MEESEAIWLSSLVQTGYTTVFMSSGQCRLVGLVAGALSAVGAGMLVYGAVVESNRLVVENYTLPLPNWPAHLNGFRVAVLGDFHLCHQWSLELGKRAIAAALAEAPDMIALVGDFVAYWNDRSPEQLGELLEPLRLMPGEVVAIPGNHDYHLGNPSFLSAITTEYHIKLLRNESWSQKGISWVGIDSAREQMDDAKRAIDSCKDAAQPKVVLWHEPDAVDRLPEGCALQLSGHSHGGQFRLPFGITPMHSVMGRKYPRGFYPDAPTPLFVTRGVGTTGPPSRFLCPPEVAILTLVSDG